MSESIRRRITSNREDSPNGDNIGDDNMQKCISSSSQTVVSQEDPHENLQPTQPTNFQNNSRKTILFFVAAALVGILLSFVFSNRNPQIKVQLDPQQFAASVTAALASIGDVDLFDLGRILPQLPPGGILAALPTLAALLPQNQPSTEPDLEEFMPGIRLVREQGIQATHPVVFIPGIVSTQLEVWNPPPTPPTNSSQSAGSTERCGQKYFRKRLWGTFNQFRALLLDKACWIAHMQLDAETGMDPIGVKLRASQGLDAADYLFPGYWVWARIISNFAAIGADINSMFLASFDWRLSLTNLEKRDLFFSRLKSAIELAHRHHNRKVAVIAHSMGNLVFMYFLSWVRAPISAGGGGGGEGWPDKYLHRWINIAGPMLGVPKTLAPMLSGETRDSAQLNAYAAAVVDQFLSREERADLFRSWGGLASMFPKGGSSVWGKAGEQAPDSPLHSSKTNLASTSTFSDMLTVRYADASGSIVNISSHDADQSIEFVKNAVGEPYASRWKTDYDNSIAQTTRDISTSIHKPETWSNPLIAPLPSFKSGQFEIHCYYGVGIPTERKYHYAATRPPSTTPPSGKASTDKCQSGTNSAKSPDPSCLEQPVVDSTGEALAINTSYHDPELGIQNGIETSDGDGAVPLLSLGFMCARGWRNRRYNPSNVRVVLREYDSIRTSTLMPPIVRGTDSVDHTDIMGNHALIEDVLKATSSNERLEDRVVSDIMEMSKRVELPDMNGFFGFGF